MEITKIFGPPGTGKTTTLISMLRKELENGTSIKDVAYLTHTRAGADEVKKRIGEQFSDQMKKDLLWFRTIHSACCKVQGITAKETIGPYHRELFEERYGYVLDGRSALDGNPSDLSWDAALEVRSYASATMRDIEDVRRERAKDYRFQPDRFYSSSHPHACMQRSNCRLSPTKLRGTYYPTSRKKVQQTPQPLTF